MKRYIPTQLAMVSYPEMFEPGKGRTTMNKRHNAATKEALRRCLKHHHRYNVPKHFQFGSHAKYQYNTRSEVTKNIKSKLGKKYLDLVLTGKTKNKMTKSYNRIRVGGTTYGGVGAMTATLTVSWPPGYYDNPRAKPGAITKAKMRDEIEMWTESEQAEMATLFLRFYVEEMQKRINTGARITKKFSSQLKSQGII